jgi:hypothetical protein
VPDRQFPRSATVEVVDDVLTFRTVSYTERGHTVDEAGAADAAPPGSSPSEVGRLTLMALSKSREGMPPVDVEGRRAWLRSMGFRSEKEYERNRKLVRVEEWEPGQPGRYRIMPTRHIAKQNGYEFISELDISAEVDDVLGDAILQAVEQSTHE